MGNGPVTILIARSSFQLKRKVSAAVISEHTMIPSSRVRSVFTKKGIEGNPWAMHTKFPFAPEGRRPTGENPGASETTAP